MSAITNVVYPTTPTGFLEFDATAGVFLGDGTPNWNPVIAIEYTGGERLTVYQEGAFLGSFRSRSSTTGVGTVVSPLHFRVRPERWPVNRGIKLVPRPVDLVVGTAVTTNPEPAGFEARVPLRQFQSFTSPLLVNLGANPMIRTGKYALIELHQLVTNPQTGSEITGYNTAKGLAVALSPPMRVIPAWRVMSSGGTENDWFDAARVTTQTANLGIMAALRYQHAGDSAIDPTIEIDIEGYGAGYEPTEASLTTHNKAQFDAAWAPFFTAALALSPLPVFVFYPSIAFSTATMHLFARRALELFGKDRVHFVTETHGFVHTVNDHRTLRYTDHVVNATAWSTDKGSLEVNVLGGDSKMRTFIEDDILRDTGALFTASEYAAFGRMAPEIQDWTRADRTSWGTPNSQHWLTLSTANKTLYGWAFPGNTVNKPMSTGENASVSCETYNSAVTTSEAIGPVLTVDLNGARLMPPSGKIYGVCRVANVMPTATPQAWTQIMRFQIPASIVVDTALFGQRVSNVNAWQVYIRVSDGALVWERNGVDQQVIAATSARDTDIKIAICRNGNTNWRYSINGAAVGNFTAGATVSAFNFAVLGGGGTPGTAGNFNLQSCVGMLIKSWRIAHNTYSDADLVTASGTTYPVGRGT